VETADRLPNINIFEQGAGRMNAAKALEWLHSDRGQPHASALPATLHLNECPYMWPFCEQPLYAHALPVIVNVTLLNSMGVTGRIIDGPKWKPGSNGDHLHITYSHADIIWPYSGSLALHITVKSSAENFDGIVKGEVALTVESEPGPGESAPRRSSISLPVTAQVVPTPPREKRVLWDQFHSVAYPPGYVPRDDIQVSGDMLDMYGDHPHTNFRGVYAQLRQTGYFLEILGRPLTCFDAAQYSTLIIVDSEDLFSDAERKKLQVDVDEKGLSVAIFAEWYEPRVMSSVKFMDDNTRMMWHAVVGGAHVPALNQLLEPWGIAFGTASLRGSLNIQGLPGGSLLSSATEIARFPKGGYMVKNAMQQENGGWGSGEKHGVLGFYQTPANPDKGGRIVVFPDSNCLDDHKRRGQPCMWLLEIVLQFTANRVLDSRVDSATGGALDAPFSTGDALPKAPVPDPIVPYSHSTRITECSEAMAVGDGTTAAAPPLPPPPPPAASFEAAPAEAVRGRDIPSATTQVHPPSVVLAANKGSGEKPPAAPPALSAGASKSAVKGPPLILSSSANRAPPGIVIKQVEFHGHNEFSPTQSDVYMKIVMGLGASLVIVFLLCAKTRSGRKKKGSAKKKGSTTESRIGAST